MATITSSFGSSSQYGLKITVTENSQNVANNTTNVTVVMQITSSQSNGAYNNNQNNSVSLSVNGSTVASSSSINLDFRSSNCPHTVASWTGNITHTSDGTKTLPLAGSIYFNSSSSSSLSRGTYSISGSVNLTTIPRASSVSAQNKNIGATTKITISKASTGFYHTVKLVFGTKTVTVKDWGNSPAITHTNTDTEEYNYAIPTAWGAEIPTSKTGTCTITCTTYSDSGGTNQIGTSQATFTVTAPNDMTITRYGPGGVNGFNINDHNLYELTGSTRDTPILVDGQSTIRTSGTFTASNGATLASITVTDGKNKKSATIPAGSTSYSVGENETWIDFPNATNLTTGSTMTYTVTATDSRGYTKTGSRTADVRPYSTPTISLSLSRSSSTPTTVTATLSGAVTHYIVKADNTNYTNNVTLTLLYREYGTSGSYTAASVQTPTYTNTSYSATSTITNLDTTKSYEIIAGVTDNIYGTEKTTTRRIKEYLPAWSWDKTTFNLNTNLTFDDLDQLETRRIFFYNTANGTNNTYKHQFDIFGGSPTSYRAFGFRDRYTGEDYVPFSYIDKYQQIMLYGTGSTNYLADFPYVVKSFTDSSLTSPNTATGYYKRYNSNMVETWIVATFAVSQGGTAVTGPNSSQSVYYTPVLYITLPFQLSSAVITGQTNHSGFITAASVSTNNRIAFRIARGTTFQAENYDVHLHILGRVGTVSDREYQSD